MTTLVVLLGLLMAAFWPRRTRSEREFDEVFRREDARRREELRLIQGGRDDR